MGTPATSVTKSSAAIHGRDTAERSAYYWILVALVVAGSCVRISSCFQHNPVDYLFSDMQRHWQNGVHFPKGGYTGGADPIGYQVYVWGLQRITFGNRLLIALASALLSVFMPWTYYRAAREFGLTKRSALWVWALIAWTPSLLIIYHYIMPETLLLVLEGLALWSTARYIRKGGALAFFESIFVWTLASLTKPTVIPLAGICFLWSWWKRSTPLRDVAAAVVLAAVMLIPQGIRSRVALGFFAPFGNSWLTRIQLRSGATVAQFRIFGQAPAFMGIQAPATEYDLTFFSPSASIRPLWPLSDWATRRALRFSTAKATIDFAHGERDWKDTYNRFNADRGERLAQWRENIVLFFFAPSWPETTKGQSDELDYLSRWLWAPLILCVLAGNIREFVQRRFHLLPVAVTVFTLIMALQNLLIMEGRYRKPVETLLLLNLVWLLAGKSRRSERPQTSE